MDGSRKRKIETRGAEAAEGAFPVVLFSHGLGGSREGNRFLGEHWARRGYIAIFVQHPGSDGAVWKDVPQAERFAALRSAASLENFVRRVDHVRTVLDTMARWNAEPKPRPMDLGMLGTAMAPSTFWKNCCRNPPGPLTISWMPRLRSSCSLRRTKVMP